MIGKQKSQSFLIHQNTFSNGMFSESHEFSRGQFDFGKEARLPHFHSNFAAYL